MLQDAGFLNEAASRAYYAASALLLSQDLAFGSHTGVLRAVSLHFVKPGILDRQYGRDLNWLAEIRQIADYGELKTIDTSETQAAIACAERFLTQVQEILRST
ncbi:HEPN domain-containing protein [Thermoleptolyngbya sichuanensis A183]|uniref:HEPN domain-containing protein n=1 Tax=Thermoleptolyngbya sichuanensis A183 TaxID=2737172 RepID=A0A6M8BGC4_9CYAN|nr:HEPN domain-containing protein [Thermoleptolyngbya sp. PKUAC-SCTB121]QKD82661.1 HEPN domain-containing protein [Thermoleptolyngbya sichuanensis A183]